MVRILHATPVKAGEGKNLDLELLLNRIGGIFKPDEEATENDESLQVALSAQVREANYENPYMTATCPRGTKNQDHRNKLLQVLRNLRKWYSI